MRYPFSGGNIHVHLEAELVIPETTDGSERGSKLEQQMDSAFALCATSHLALASVFSDRHGDDEERRTAKVHNTVTIGDLTLTAKTEVTAHPSGMCDGEFVETAGKAIAAMWHPIIDAFKPGPTVTERILEDLRSRFGRGIVGGLIGGLLSDYSDRISVLDHDLDEGHPLFGIADFPFAGRRRASRGSDKG